MTKHSPFFSPKPVRPYPTLREMLRGPHRGGKFRAPWYAGFPNRSHSSWAQSLKKR
jgi:hypothetical protein